MLLGIHPDVMATPGYTAAVTTLLAKIPTAGFVCARMMTKPTIATAVTISMGIDRLTNLSARRVVAISEINAVEYGMIV